MEPLVSVAMATFNGAAFLRDQLDSIYSQTYKNIEVVVCDDCSVDATVEILEEYANRYGLKYCVNEKQLGFVKNFEKAIIQCRGEYIALCDQDDIWVPEKIETLLVAINGKPLVCSDLILVNKDKEIIDSSLYRHTGLQFYNNDQFKYLVHSNFVVGCTTLFNAKLKQYILPFPEGIPFHDWWIALVASAHGGIEFCTKPLVYYRYHGGNNTHTGRKVFVKTVIEKIKEVNNKIKNNFYSDKCKLLSTINKHHSLQPLQKKYIEEIIKIYEALDSRIIPLKATYLAFKNRNYMFPKRGPIKKAIFTIGIVFASIVRLIDITSKDIGSIK